MQHTFEVVVRGTISDKDGLLSHSEMVREVSNFCEELHASQRFTGLVRIHERRAKLDGVEWQGKAR